MGGLLTPLAEAAEKFASKVAPKITNELSPVVKRAIAEKIAPMESAFKQSKAGNEIFERYNNFYRPKEAEITSTLTKAALNPTAAGTIMQPHEIRITARNQARAQAFGAKDEGLAYLLSQAKKEKGDMHANILADHLGVLFHDAAYEDARNNKRANTLVRNLQSYAKKSGQEEGEIGNKFLPKNHEPYIPPGAGEAKIRRYANATFAPHAAIPHAVSSFFTFLADGAVPYTKAVFSAIPLHNYENSRLFLKTTNAISELHTIEYNQHFMYEQSKFKKVLNDKFQWIPNSVGEIIHSNLSMPGMSAVRKWNLTVAGMSAKFQAEEMAARIMQEESGGYAESELKRFGLNPDKIKAQGGNLTTEDLRTAIFKGADYSAFLEGSMQRTQFSQASMTGRTMFTFHTYIARSAKAIKGALYKEIAAKNPAGIARVLGTLALIAPEIGNAVQYIENVAHGKGTDSAGNDWSQSEHQLHGQDGFLAMLESHIDALSHIGAFGVATGYNRAMSRNSLANAVAGPVPNALFRAIQDIHNYFLVRDGSWKPVARDFLTDIPTLGLGGIASHKFIPTKQEEAAKRPKTAKQIKAAQTRAMHKKH